MARPDAVLKNLPPEVLDELWDLKNPADPREQEPLTLVSICALLPERYGVTLQKSALAEFYQWLEVHRRMQARERLTDQLKELIARDASLTPEQVRQAGQRLFMADGILEKDVAKFKAAADSEGADYKAKQKDAELALRKEANAIARDRLTAATRTKIDAGLDALYDEIKGNAKAVALFGQIKEVIRKA